MGLVNKAYWVLRNRGVKVAWKKTLVKLHLSEELGDPVGDLDYIWNSENIPLNKSDMEIAEKSEKIIINWIVPAIGKGSGGHLDIFRFASMLEEMGFHSRVVVGEYSLHRSDSDLKKFVLKNYPIADKRIEFVNKYEDIKFAHITFCTSWKTAYLLNKFDNTRCKAYFVQDFEPYFYGRGSYYSFAEETYRMGFYGITAGEWLRKKLSTDYNMNTSSFNFSYDKTLYKLHENPQFTRKIFFYTRPYTNRRYFEMGLVALNMLIKKIPDLDIIFAGEDLKDYIIPFKHQSLGIVDLDKLSDIYGSCDFCLVFSATNMSLLPLEIMGSGSVVVSNKGANNWLLNDENSILPLENPEDICNKIVEAYGDREKYIKIRDNGIQLALNSSWEKEAKKVAKSIRSVLC